MENKIKIDLILYRNKIFIPILLTNSKKYEKLYDELETNIFRGIVSTKVPVIQKEKKKTGYEHLSEEDLMEVFTEERKRKLGKLLEFLLPSNQKKLLQALEKRHPDIYITTVDGKPAILLDRLTASQLLTLLELAKEMKSRDFDTSQLVNVQIDPGLPA